MRSVRKFGLLLASLLAIATLSSCIREDLSDCPIPFRLTLQAVDADGKDITSSGRIVDATLFIFDEKGQVVDIQTLDPIAIKQRKEIVLTLDQLRHQSLNFIVWANTDKSKVAMPDFTANTAVMRAASVQQLNDLYVRLISRQGVALSPSDLFGGSIVVPIEYGEVVPRGEHTIVVSPKVAQVYISAIGIKRWNGGKEGNYTFRLKASPDTYDQNGQLTGEKVHYIPMAKMQGDVFTAPIFTTFPTIDQKPYTLEILCDGEVIYSASVDSKGHAFVPQVGRLLNIIVDFSGHLDVMAVVTPWNTVYQYVTI